MLTPGETAVLAAPLFILLAAWIFAVDERMAGAKRVRRRRRFGLAEVNGRAMLTDPDGRPWKAVAGEPCEDSSAQPVEKSELDRLRWRETTEDVETTDLDCRTCFLIPDPAAEEEICPHAKKKLLTRSRSRYTVKGAIH